MAAKGDEKRGRPPLGDQPLTRAEHEARRRARIATQISKARSEIALTGAEIRQRLWQLTAQPVNIRRQVDEAEQLILALQAQVELLLGDLGRIHGASSLPGVLYPTHVITFQRRPFLVWHTSGTEVWLVPIIGRSGTARHRAEIRVENPISWGIAITDPVVRCDQCFCSSIDKLRKVVPCGAVPLSFLSTVIKGIHAVQETSSLENRLHFMPL